jgi:hypothetical protein
MHNTDLIAQLDALTEAAAALRQDLSRSDDMLPMPLAVALVKAAKVNHDFEKLAKQARAGIAPLFGKSGDGDADQGDSKPGRKPRK